MLDRDLAELYQVETRVLNQQVKRNIKRFPDDFMFQLTEPEFENLISQNVTSSWGGTRKLPLVFTEQGLAIEKLEKKTDNNTKNIEVVFQYFDELTAKKETEKPRTKISYKLPKK